MEPRGIIQCFNTLTLMPRRFIINGVQYSVVTSKVDIDAMRKRFVIAVTLRATDAT